jgi:hypothetical protein
MVKLGMLMLMSLAFALPISLFVWALCYAAILRRKSIKVSRGVLAANLLLMWALVATHHRFMAPDGAAQANSDALSLAWVWAIWLCLVTRIVLVGRQRAAVKDLPHQVAAHDQPER